MPRLYQQKPSSLVCVINHRASAAELHQTTLTALRATEQRIRREEQAQTQFAVSAHGLNLFPSIQWPRSFRRVEFPMISPAPSMETNPIAVFRALGNNRLCSPCKASHKGHQRALEQGRCPLGMPLNRGFGHVVGDDAAFQPVTETFLWVMERSRKVTCHHFAAEQDVMM